MTDDVTSQPDTRPAPGVVYRWGVVAREGVAYAMRVLTSALSFVSL